MDKGNTHSDWHALWINPNKDNHMIAGNDGGCNITYDSGKNWFKANSPGDRCNVSPNRPPRQDDHTMQATAGKQGP